MSGYTACAHCAGATLQESHTIKEAHSRQARACTSLAGERRWCVSGTPVNTDIGDLLSQFGFLGFQPFSLKPFFDAHVRQGHQPVMS